MQLDNHLDYKTTCQEYKDCPSQCQDQACKDQCLLKTCYYYHCSTYKTCWDACADQACQAQCSYKGCDYGLLNNIQSQIDQVYSCICGVKCILVRQHHHGQPSRLGLQP